MEFRRRRQNFVLSEIIFDTPINPSVEPPQPPLMKNQAFLLYQDWITKLILTVDGIPMYGNSELCQRRKTLIQEVQDEETRLDEAVMIAWEKVKMQERPKDPQFPEVFDCCECRFKYR